MVKSVMPRNTSTPNTKLSMLDINTTHLMSCVDGMQLMDAESVDLCITSPPYDDLRTYNDSSKWDFNVFKEVAAGLARVLKPGGVIMWLSLIHI